ncbi:MAG: hypothetical protein KJZ86_01110 [Caldilineaceae bacterium]|nr:hypothetical protein [Caldilineaceae bacterium]HRJ42044.1 hypothetical protein [Caldilineaceae bacterium]
MAIVVDSRLESAVERLARMLARPAQQIADEAIRAHLAYLRAQQLEEEAQAYLRLHPALVKPYKNQFVALHKGRVVDSDADFEELFLRVQSRLGDLPVLIQQVLDSPVEEWRFRSPRGDLA